MLGRSGLSAKLATKTVPKERQGETYGFTTTGETKEFGEVGESV